MLISFEPPKKRNRANYRGPRFGSTPQHAKNVGTDRLEDGEKSPPLQNVRRTLTGRYFIPRAEVRRLRSLNAAPENDF